MLAITHFSDAKGGRDRMMDSFIIDLLVSHSNIIISCLMGPTIGRPPVPRWVPVVRPPMVGGNTLVLIIWIPECFQVGKIHRWYRFLVDRNKGGVSYIHILSEWQCLEHFSLIFQTYVWNSGTWLSTFKILFRKPTAANSLLQYSSFHPQHLKKGIQYGQYVRLRRNGTELDDFKKHAKELMEHFLCRGYPKKLLSQAYTKALRLDRKTLLIRDIEKNLRTSSL